MNRQLATHRRAAFSLAELLAALVLASMLLVVLMGLTGRLARTNRNIVMSRPDHTWQTQLAESLQSDFENARSVTVRPKLITFEGYSIPRSNSPAPTEEIPIGHVPTLVTYEVVPSEEQSWLLRTETVTNSNANATSKQTLMVFGCTRFRPLEYLETDVAPPILRLILSGPAFGDPGEIQLNLVRHGGIPE